MNKYFTRENYGFLLGFIGVVIFSLTLPITRHLTQVDFTSLEIGFGRGFLAGIASVFILLFKGQFKTENLPSKTDLRKLIITAIGVVFAFPIFTAIAMQTIPAGNGGIVLAAVPLSTAIFAGLLSEENPTKRFWGIAVIGFITVTVFRLLTNDLGITNIGFGDFALLKTFILIGSTFSILGIDIYNIRFSQIKKIQIQYLHIIFFTIMLSSIFVLFVYILHFFE